MVLVCCNVFDPRNVPKTEGVDANRSGTRFYDERCHVDDAMIYVGKGEPIQALCVEYATIRCDSRANQ